MGSGCPPAVELSLGLRFQTRRDSPYPTWCSSPFIDSPNVPGRLGKSGGFACPLPTTTLLDAGPVEDRLASSVGGSCGGAAACGADEDIVAMGRVR